MKKKVLKKDDVLHLAKLANLSLSNNEIEKLRSQLTETVDYVENLNQLKTDDVIPTDQTINVTNIFFEDGEKNDRQLSQEQALKNAKKKNNKFFIVEKILRKEE